MGRIYFLFVCSLLSASLSDAENCPTIDATELEIDIANARNTGEGSPNPVIVTDFTVNCRVPGTVRDTYSSISVTASYSIPDESATEAARISLDCQVFQSATDWDSTGFRIITGSGKIAGLLNEETLTNCSSCKGTGGDGDFECVGMCSLTISIHLFYFVCNNNNNNLYSS